VADACTFFITKYETEGDPARARAYLETACQHGSPLACNELGRRLLPGCAPEPGAPCYPPDPDEAAAARAIACEVGFADACS
jgi:TPR repeat protein